MMHINTMKTVYLYSLSTQKKKKKQTSKEKRKRKEKETPLDEGQSDENNGECGIFLQEEQ